MLRAAEVVGHDQHARIIVLGINRPEHALVLVSLSGGDSTGDPCGIAQRASVACVTNLSTLRIELVSALR
jgi:hypothetical protein